MATARRGFGWMALWAVVGVVASCGAWGQGGARGSYLRIGEILAPGQYLVSPHGYFHAITRADGNLCVHKGSGPADDRGILWCGVHDGPAGSYSAALGTDGRLCTYAGTSARDARSVAWCSGPSGLGVNFYWTQQDDGNLCIYKGGPGVPLGVQWCSGVTSAPPAGGTAAVVPTREQLAQWIQAYAPVVYFNAAEKYFPTSAEGFLAISSPAGSGLALRDTSEAAKAGNLALARPYVNAKIGPTTTDLQYWFLYAYNGPGIAYWKYLKPWTGHYEAIGDYTMEPCGQHEGDWEHITVRVDNRSGQLVAAYLSQHDHGAWFPPAAVNLSGGRITFYPSRNGHAAYWRPDRAYSNFVSLGGIEFRLLNDTGHPGRAFDTRANGGPLLIAVQNAPFAVAAPAWMQVKGRWGRVYERGVAAARRDLEDRFGKMGGMLASLGTVQLADIVMDKAGLKSECSEEAGPQPPWSKGNWTGADD